VDRFANRLPLTIAPNVRPSLRHEDLTPARMRLAEVISDLREERIAGFEELNQWSGGYLMVTADAFGRVVRYLSQIYSPDKGVLGVDLGASQTTVAVAFDGTLRIGVQSDLGMGSALTGLLAHSSIEQIRAWLPIDLPEDFVRDYLYDKALNPGTIPAEIEDLHLELAMAREILRVVTARARAGWPEGKNTRDAWLMPALEPIIAAGGTLGRTPRPGYSALVLLDAIQPTGITTLVLDPHNLTPALGVAAGPLPIVSVQVLESGGYVSLGTVISPVGSARVGRRLMRVQLEREASGEEIVGEVRMGQLIVLAMEQGEHGRLTLRPERGIDVGFGGPGKAGTVRVSGGAVGLIIDARGRPLQFPKDLAQRRDLNQKWLWDIGAME
jgi:hypothetical protein